MLHMDWLLEALGAVVLLVSSKMPMEADRTTSLFGSWFLSPRQHGLEFLLFNLIIAVFLAYNVRRAWAESRRYFVESGPRPRSSRLMARIMDPLILVTLLVTIGATVFYKFKRDTYMFLLQPCHVSIMMLIVLMLRRGGEKSSLLSHFFFNVYLHISWGGMLAICFPDTRDYSQFLEVEVFWIEHAFLVVVPLYMMFTRRFQVFRPSLAMGFASFGFMALYHSLILATASLLTGKNLNYVLVPPPGLLEYFDKYYRVVMYLGCLPLTVLTRYVFWQPLFLLVDKVHSYTSGPLSPSLKPHDE